MIRWPPRTYNDQEMRVAELSDFAQPLEPPDIMPVMWKPVTLPYKSLPGFSEELISDHYDLYKGYLDRFNKLEPLLALAVKKGDKWAVQRIAQEEGFLRNAGRLHELYFTNLAPGGKGDTAKVLGPAYKAWITKMALMGMGSHGWVILALDLEEKKPFLFTMKEHGQGYVNQSLPLLVLDMYEHAWMPKFRLNKAAYIDAFFKNVDWDIVHQRLERAMRLA